MAQFKDSDGNLYDIPDFAMESTLQKVAAALGANADDISKVLNKNQKQQNKADQEANKDRDTQTRALQDLVKTANKTTVFEGSYFNEGLKKGGKLLKSFTLGALGLAASGVTALAFSAKSLGEELKKTQMVGVGLDTVEQSALGLITSFNALGFSTQEATQFLGDYSQVIQTGGRTSFARVNQAFMDATRSGTAFGITLQEAASVLGEDLKFRQQLGILQGYNESQQAKRSAALFQQQIEATAILGKSIDDIRDAANATLENNASVALRIQAVAAQLGNEAGAEFTSEIQKAMGDLAAIGLRDRVASTIANEALSVVAFASDEGKALYGALTVFDGVAKQAGYAGKSIRESIVEINQLSKTDPAAAAEALNKLDEQFMEAAKSLSTPEFNQLQVQLAATGVAGEELALSLGQMRQAAENQAKNPTIARLAESAATFDNAVSMFTGGLNSALNNITGAIAQPIAAITDAFTKEGVVRNEMGAIMKNENEAHKYTAEQVKQLGLDSSKVGEEITDLAHLTKEQREETQKVNSIFSVFRDVMVRINRAFEKAFSDGTTGINRLSNTIRNKLTPIIKTMGDKIEKFILNIKPEDIENAIDTVVDGIYYFGETLKAIGRGIKKVFDFFKVTEEVPVLDAEGNPTGETKEQINMGKTLTNMFIGALVAAVAVKAVVGAFSGLFAKGIEKGAGLLGDGARKLLGLGDKKGGGKNAGGSMAKTGAGAFAGAAGIAAFGAAAAGAGVFVGQFANAVEKLGEMRWQDLAQGMAAAGGSIALFAGGLAILGPKLEKGALGIAAFALAAASIGVAAGGIAMAIEAVAKLKTANAEAEATKLQASADVTQQLADIPQDRIIGVANAVNTLSGALMNMSESVGDSGSWWNPFDSGDGADIDKQQAQIGIFTQFAQLDGNAISAAADGLTNIQEAYAKIMELDADKLTAIAEAMREVGDANKGPGLFSIAKNAIADKMGFGDSATDSPSPASRAGVATAGDGTPVGGMLEASVDAKYIVAKLSEKLSTLDTSVKSGTKKTKQAISNME